MVLFPIKIILRAKLSWHQEYQQICSKQDKIVHLTRVFNGMDCIASIIPPKRLSSVSLSGFVFRVAKVRVFEKKNTQKFN
jgi:hypothetical protein